MKEKPQLSLTLENYNKKERTQELQWKEGWKKLKQNEKLEVKERGGSEKRDTSLYYKL